jgi:hypothetical protein
VGAKFQHRTVVRGKNVEIVLGKSLCAEYPELENATVEVE